MGKKITAEDAQAFADTAVALTDGTDCGKTVATTTGIGTAVGAPFGGVGAPIGAAIGAAVGLGVCAAEKLKRKPKGTPAGVGIVVFAQAVTWSVGKLRFHGITEPGDELEAAVRSVASEALRAQPKWNASSASAVWRSVASITVTVAGATPEQARAVAASSSPTVAAEAFLQSGPTAARVAGATGVLPTPGKLALLIGGGIAAWYLGVM